MRKPLLLALSLLGLFDSAYLWWVYTSPSRPLVCLGTGCDVVRASSYANLWGLPLPAYGVATYAVLALLIFAEALAGDRLKRGIRLAVAAISCVGFLTSFYLTGIEAFVLHAWCAWCVFSALTITFIFILALLELVRPAPQPDAASALATMRTHFVVFAIAVVIVIPAFLYLSRHGELSPARPVSPEALSDHLVRPDSHVAGSPKAPVTVVEFGDFQCPACGRTEPAAREIREKYGNQIRFVFRHFPFESMHPQAEKAAEASECAAEQGKFWEALEKFYQGQGDLSEPALKRYAAELGLDQGRFSQCLSSGKMAARLRRDVDDAHALGVRATPTFFVGRQRIERALDFGQFAQLIDHELASRGVAVATFDAPMVGAHDSAPEHPAKPWSAGAKPAEDPSPTPGLLSNNGSGIFSQFQTSATACREDEAKQQQPTLIRTPEARQIFEGGLKAQFVDVRSTREFGSGRIPGAINLPVDEIERRWSSLPKNRTLVLYESGQSPGDVCASSRAAGRVLLAHGFRAERVKVYRDGLAGWKETGLPVER